MAREMKLQYLVLVFVFPSILTMLFSLVCDLDLRTFLNLLRISEIVGPSLPKIKTVKNRGKRIVLRDNGTSSLSCPLLHDHVIFARNLTFVLEGFVYVSAVFANILLHSLRSVVQPQLSRLAGTRQKL